MLCPVCQNNIKGDLQEIWEDYKLYRCKICEVVFSHPMEEAKSEFYEPESYSWRWEFGEFLKDISNLGRGKILDVGCGSGCFLLKGKEKGYPVTGIDFNEKAIAEAKKRGLKNVFVLKLEDFIETYPEEKFDFVVFFHLLEHLKDPNYFLKLIKNILKENGLMGFSVPNPNWVGIKIFGQQKWNYPPHHLLRFTEKSLKILLNKNGFEILKIKEQPASFYSDVAQVLHMKAVIKVHFGIDTKLKEIIPKNSKKRWIILILAKIKQLSFVFFTIPLDLVFILFRYLPLKNKKGSTLYILAKPKICQTKK